MNYTSRYICGRRSGREDSACPIFTKEGPSDCSTLHNWRALCSAFCSTWPSA